MRLMSGSLGVADGQRLDVEVARPHQAGDAVEDAGPVVDEDDEDVAVLPRRCPGRSARRGRPWRAPARVRIVHGCHRQRSFLRSPQVSMRSDRPLPAGIIGKHVLLLGDLEPDQRRAVDRLRGADGGVDLLGRAWP